MTVTILPGDATLRGEIDRQLRTRLKVASLATAFAVLLLSVAVFALRILYGGDAVPVTATIVELKPYERVAEMTSEFVDDAGRLRRDAATYSEYYSLGEPAVGERINYVYGYERDTGFFATPRADRLLQWGTGVPGAVFGFVAVAVVWFALRQRDLRRLLLRSGRREPGAAYVVRERTIRPPGVSESQASRTWRLEARYFDSALAGFRDCHSDWQPAPAPELKADTSVSPVLIDPMDSKRYWLPLGELAKSAT